MSRACGMRGRHTHAHDINRVVTRRVAWSRNTWSHDNTYGVMVIRMVNSWQSHGRRDVSIHIGQPNVCELVLYTTNS